MKRRRSTASAAAMLLLSLLVVASAMAQQQRISEGPVDTFVHLGKSAILRCKVEDQKGAVQWMKNGFGLGVDRQLKWFERYSMTGSSAKGEYHLRIENVTHSDDDSYACQVSEADGEPAQISSPARLTVLSRPSNPRISRRNEELHAVAGEQTRIQCAARDGKPPPRIGWAIATDTTPSTIKAWVGDTRGRFSHIIKNGDKILDVVPGIAEEDIIRDEHKFHVHSNLSFSPRSSDNDRYLLCLSQHETFPDKIEVSAIKMRVKYAPKVSVKITFQGGQGLREGGSAMLQCVVDANPLENVRIAWLKNAKETLDLKSDTLTLDRLSSQDHGAEYTCQATNVIGTSSASATLHVNFAPKITSPQQDVEVNAGEPVTFHCAAIGNPPPSVYWTRVGDERIIGKGENFTIDAVERWQRGEYDCTAASQGWQQAKLTHLLSIRSPPNVMARPEIAADEGESVELVCEIHGRPRAHEVLWRRDGVELGYGAGAASGLRPLRVGQSSRGYGVESRLTIGSLRASDYGTYNCSAENVLGKAHTLVRLKPRSLLDRLERQMTADVDPILIAAAVASILLLLLCLLCCLCCCCCRRCGRSGKKKKARKETSSNSSRSGGSGYKKRRVHKFIALEDEPDVHVKCEALDGLPDMYGVTSAASPTAVLVDDGQAMVIDREYISIAHQNPDLDILGARPTYYAPAGAAYLTPMEYRHHPQTPLHYGSFLSSELSTPIYGEALVQGAGKDGTGANPASGVPSAIGGGGGSGGTERTTPDSATTAYYQPPGATHHRPVQNQHLAGVTGTSQRPSSRSSTHV